MWMRRILASALFMAVAPTGFATPVDVLPFSPEQIQDFGTAIAGGTFSCATTGQYVASTGAFTQTGSCNNFGETGTSIDRIGDGAGGGLRVDNWEASLTGFVDNDGNLIEGSFSLFGAIPEVGIEVDSLLATGRLLEVYYGPVFGEGDNPVVLIEITDAVAALQEFGPILSWNSFATIGEWSGETCFEDPACAPWQVDASSYDNFTGSSYTFFNRAVLVSAPGSLPLLALGLAIAWRMRRRFHEPAPAGP